MTQPRVHYTEALEQQLLETGADPATLKSDFAAWKAKGEYASYLFGKDSAYTAPDVTDQALRHVHLVPIGEPEALNRWNKAWRRRSRKTSDRALVYVATDTYGYLLLFILDEPSAHAVAQMKTPEHKELMHRFAAVAEAFLHDGSIAA